MRRWHTVATTLMAFLGIVPAGARGQAQESKAITLPAVEPLSYDPDAADVPFGPGERLEYEVKLGIFSVGDGYMEVAGIDTIRGHPSYHLRMGLEGDMFFAHVDDRYESWLDTRSLVSRRFIRDIDEVGYESYREWAIYPEQGRWERVDEERSDSMATERPLDEIAFLYFLRTLPLEVGRTYTLDRYFKDEGNPVVIEVLRRERKTVPAGTFNTIVVQPVIQTDGLFSEGGHAEVYLTDDENRHLVYLRSEIPVVGSVTLHLKSIREGKPLTLPDGQ